MSERAIGKDSEAFAPESVKDLMKKDWDRRAEEDYRFYIDTGHAGSDEAFRKSGGRDLDEVILDGIELDPSAEALEIGCGVGRLLVPLSERVAVAHGVDISDVMIRKSKAFCGESPRIRTQTIDGSLRHLPDSSIDFVFSFIVFQHIPSREAIETYVKEAARVLRPGGIFRFQVDGRWWLAREEADTYNGVKFSPGEARKLLSGTGFEVIDEWGAESHYHRLTVRLPAGEPAARVSVRSREYDQALLTELLGRVGDDDPSLTAGRIIDGSETLWTAIQPLQTELAGESDEVFVREVFRRLLGRRPDAQTLEFHSGILKSHLEERSAVIDTVVTGSGLRDLLYPIAGELAWFRREGARRELGLAPDVPFFDLVSAVTARITGLSVDDAIVNAFWLTLGQRPDKEGLQFYRALSSSHPHGLRLVVRDLLTSQDSRSVPPPVSATHIDRLARKSGPLVGARLGRGQSFSGEALFASQILEEGIDLSDRDFVRFIYENALGRPADPEGLEFYSSKLANRLMSRPVLLRELLWSDELRGD